MVGKCRRRVALVVILDKLQLRLIDDWGFYLGVWLPALPQQEAWINPSFRVCYKASASPCPVSLSCSKIMSLTGSSASPCPVSLSCSKMMSLTGSSASPCPVSLSCSKIMSLTGSSASPCPVSLSCSKIMSLTGSAVFMFVLRICPERAGSPVPSCLSMKSNASMDPPIYFRGELTVDQR